MFQIPQFRHRLWSDLETRSLADIKAGSYVYGERAELLLYLYALDDGAPSYWDAINGQPIPRDLDDYLRCPEVQLVFHNKDFDRVQMWSWPWMRQRYPLGYERWLCTMQVARSCGLPGGLDALCKVLGVPETYAKKDGDRLIRWFCIPRGDGVTYNAPHERPDLWQEFISYGLSDVIAMREVFKRLPTHRVLNPIEAQLSLWTDLMNDRGIPIDRALATIAMGQAESIRRKAKRDARDALIEGGMSGDEADEYNPASQKALLAIFASYGITLSDARSATVEAMLNRAEADELPTTLRRLLEIRFRTHKSAPAKFAAVLRCTSSDGRARGLIAFGGAARTGRDSGRRFQPQNQARPVLLDDKLTMEAAVDIVKHGNPAEQFGIKHMQLLSDCVRGVITAPQGKWLCVADLRSIEGRKLAWFAGDQPALQFYRDSDSGAVQYDAYMLAYALAFGGDPAAVTKPQRTLGKPIELACGYGGSVGGLLAFCAVYHVSPQEMAAAAAQAADPYLWKDCRESYDWFLGKGRTYGLDIDTWTGCYYVIRAWRRARKPTVDLWAKAGMAFRLAIRNPGQVFEAGRQVQVMKEGEWLFVQLPSGRLLTYPMACEERPGDDKSQLWFAGPSPLTRRWGWQRTHNARIVENYTQAGSRDVLFWSIPRVEAAGYPHIMRVHDELIAETPAHGRWTGEDLARIISQPHSFCEDLPLAAVGETLRVYDK